MAEIATFMICDGVQIPAPAMASAPSLIAPNIALRPDFIPSNYSFGLSVGVRGVNTSMSNHFRLIIRDPQGGEVHAFQHECPPEPTKDALPEEYRGFIFSLDLRNVPLTVEGCYTVTILVNHEEAGTRLLPVYVKEG